MWRTAPGDSTVPLYGSPFVGLFRNGFLDFFLFVQVREMVAIRTFSTAKDALAFYRLFID
jgi:hypothetical protein